MKRPCPPFAALALLLCFAAPACNSATAEPDGEKKLADDLAEAATRLRNNKTADAERIFMRVLEKHPDQPDAVAGLGRVRFQQQKYDEAEGLLVKATQAKADDAELAAMLGEVYIARENHEAAAEAYGKAFTIDGDNAEYGLVYGRELKRAGRFEDAEKVLVVVADLDARAQFVHTELGDVMRETGRLDDALRSYMKAQNTHRSDKLAHAGAALVYEAKGDNKHALDEWSSYIRMDCCSEYSDKVAKPKIMQLQVAAPAGGTADATGEGAVPAVDSGAGAADSGAGTAVRGGEPKPG
jgi:tetratricopeptide (TPR) repeat protein